MSGMFQGCTNLESVDLTGIDTSKIKDMSNMFDGCSNLTTITPENIEVPEGTKTDGLFNGCENLPTRPIKVSYSVEITSSEGGTVDTNLLSIDYGSSNTMTVTPNTGYYLSSISCTNGYTTNAKVGMSQTGVQTITISNNNQDSTSTCTVTFEPTFVGYLLDLAKTDTTNFAYDGTEDNDLRYIGSMPNNYVRFNNELWRVIGVMNNVADSNGTKASRIKLIRAESIGDYSWDNQGDKGLNNWANAALQKVLNNGPYWNRASGACPSGTTYGITTKACDFSTIGLTSTAKSQISNVTWNLGGSNTASATASAFYTAERGTTVYSGNSTIWKGCVGLMYPSDFGFAIGGSDRDTCLSTNLSVYKNCYQNGWLYFKDAEWTLTHKYTSNDTVFSIYRTSRGGVSLNERISKVYGDGPVYPVVYLNTNIKRTSGSGTSSDPFTIE